MTKVTINSEDHWNIVDVPLQNVLVPDPNTKTLALDARDWLYETFGKRWHEDTHEDGKWTYGIQDGLARFLFDKTLPETDVMVFKMRWG